MKWLIIYTASATAALHNALAAALGHDWWQLAFHALCATIIISGLVTQKRALETIHRLELILATDRGRQIMIREQREMAQRSAR